jgi:hypothetical protein
MKILKAIFLIVLLAACREQIIEGMLPFVGEKVVMYGVFSANNPFKIYISKTFPPSGVLPTPEQTYLPMAVVEVYKNGKFLENLVYQKNGFYGSSTTAEADANYKVVVKATGLPVAQSSVVKVPRYSPKFTYQVTRNITPIYNTEIPKDRVSVSLFDTAQSGIRYYYFSFKGFYNDPSVSQRIRVTEESGLVEDESCGESFDAMAEWPTSRLVFGFVNTCFVNKTLSKTRIIEKGTYNYDVRDSKVFQMTHYSLFVGEMTKEYYEYLKTSGVPLGSDALFKEPYPFYSNVTNGFGMIAAANEQTVKIINP